MFEVQDEVLYGAFAGLGLSSVTKWNANKWKAITIDDYYLEVEIKYDGIYMKLAEIEYDLLDYENKILKIKMSKLFKASDMLNIKFKNIMEFMDWHCDEEQIWDVRM